MSIEEWEEQPMPSKVSLQKEVSWHYPRREQLDSLVERQQELQNVDSLIHRSSKLSGINENEDKENRRIRLRRQKTFTTAKSKTTKARKIKMP